MQRFLNPMLQHFGNPSLRPTVAKAARRIMAALEAGQTIAVFGDYDVDGMTSTALVVSALRLLGGNVVWRLPHRLNGGYGLNLERASELADLGASLVITVDCGISAVDEVSYLAGRGIDVIVTDHHQLHGDMPNALAVINPQIWDADDEFRDLAGVGVAFLLICAVSVEARTRPSLAGQQIDPKSFLDLVAMGTVADMVPLRGHNRLLVVKGLEVLAKDASRAGLAALKERAKCNGPILDAGSIAWNIAPRLNAAGRLGDASIGVELLLASERHKALELTNAVEELNSKRRLLEQAILDSAVNQVLDAGEEPTGPLVLASPDWHLGVVGIVAARVAERFRLPAILLVQDGNMVTGSARSIAGFDIAAALAMHPELFLRFGGHSQAAGLTMDVGNVDALREYLKVAYTDHIGRVGSEPELTIDVLLQLSALSADHVKVMERLAPFGTGNPEPVLASTAVRVVDKRIIKNDSLKLTFEQAGRRVEGLWWRAPELGVRVGDVVDVAYVPEMRSFQGLTTLGIKIKDMRPAA